MSYEVIDLTRGGGLTRRTIVNETFQPYELACLSSNGAWVRSNASSEATMPAIGLSVEFIPTGISGSFLLIGVIHNNLWKFTPGSLLYASRVPGKISEVPPDVPRSQVQVIGKALSQTTIMFNPSYVLVEIAEEE